MLQTINSMQYVQLTPENSAELLQQHPSSNRPIAEEAFQRGLDVFVIPGTPFLRLRVHGVELYFNAMTTPFNVHSNAIISQYKHYINA